jgi:hypothetical protein
MPPRIAQHSDNFYTAFSELAQIMIPAIVTFTKKTGYAVSSIPRNLNAK